MSIIRDGSTSSARTRAYRRPLPRACAALIVAGVLSLAGCAGQPAKPSTTDLHAEARASFIAQDYQRTLALVEPEALRGAAWAQYTLGYMYYYGRGSILDRGRAYEWIKLAAGQGYVPAKEALRRLRPPEQSQDVDGAKRSAPAATPPASANAAPLTAPVGAVQSGSPPAAPSAPATPSPAATTETPAGAAAAAPPPAAAPAVTPPLAGETNAAPSKVEPAASSAGDIRTNPWIATQTPQRLTLQLIGSGDKNAVLRYIRDHNLTDGAAYYATRRDGLPWYVVIYGNYADRGEAQSALLRLPPELRAASPWIRQFGDIQTHLTPAP